jgi:hypothetical protein
MLDNVISEITSFLIGNSPIELPLANRNTLIKFNLLLSQPNPINAHTATITQKLDAKIAINNRLLIAQEGIALIDDLNILQKKNGKTNYLINLHFGTMPIDVLTNEPRKAQGFTDIVDESSENGMKKDIPIYVRYDSNAPSTEFNYLVEEKFNLTNHINQGSSRISLTIFHELLHVWFFQTYKDPEFSGHSGQDGDENISYDPQFISRIRRFRNQIEIIEKSLIKK